MHRAWWPQLSCTPDVWLIDVCNVAVVMYACVVVDGEHHLSLSKLIIGTRE